MLGLGWTGESEGPEGYEGAEYSRAPLEYDIIGMPESIVLHLTPLRSSW
jgi:hypothetical protein